MQSIQNANNGLGTMRAAGLIQSQPNARSESSGRLAITLVQLETRFAASLLTCSVSPVERVPTDGAAFFFFLTLRAQRVEDV